MTNDIFVANLVRVSVNEDSASEIPSYFDPGYIDSEQIAAFPIVGFSNQVSSLEDYREDFTVKLTGDQTIQDTVISVYETDSEFSDILDTALLNKKKLRFRNLYVVDGEVTRERQSGLYHIFDAYVIKKETTGSDTSAVINNYTLSPDGKLYSGYAEYSTPLNVGDYGVGAGTEEIEGVKDLGLLTGNRWVTVDGINTDNPYNSGTSAMAIQHPSGQGWELIGSSIGNPSIRIRNKQMNPDGTVRESNWVKVYTELEKPTTEDIGALPITGGTLQGSLTIQEYLTVRKKINAPLAEIDKLNTKEIQSDSVKVKGQEVYSPTNKPLPIDINAVAQGETLDAGTF
ncbi:hypothetical protein AT520_003954 [Escherichia coli]|nr:hypothetical protein [Escherichia coli]EJA4827480.1 hypothetical protein [Escherichia coli]EJI1860916.1 hypothetical protein [Escherichia coli]EJK2348745.1 hypothetical protein [Escherichia coli]HBA9626652.1 hypothetical protein [Escherichia coli]